MRAVIIGNGDIKDYQYIKSKINDNDFIICADGGYNHAEKMGIVPDVLIGDFDSAKNFEKVKAVKEKLMTICDILPEVYGPATEVGKRNIIQNRKILQK